MKYQLILQFPGDKYGNLERIADMEDLLNDSLIDAVVDGHDIGGSEVNIFIDSDDPTQTFLAIKSIFEKINNGILETIKVGYRDFNESNFICLWPVNLREFSIV